MAGYVYETVAPEAIYAALVVAMALAAFWLAGTQPKFKDNAEQGLATIAMNAVSGPVLDVFGYQAIFGVNLAVYAASYALMLGFMVADYNGSGCLSRASLPVAAYSRLCHTHHVRPHRRAFKGMLHG